MSAAPAHRSTSPSTGSTLSAAESRGRVFARACRTGELNEVQGEQERLLRRIGLAPETRRFTPHVTLARLRNTSPGEVGEYLALRGPFPS